MATATLLDHMTMMYGAGIADSNAHARAISGRARRWSAGNLKGGAYQFKGLPLANLHLTLLDLLGCTGSYR